MPENYVTCTGEKGNLNISEEVIASIVSAAASEVDGLAGFAHSIGSELSEFIGRKGVSKGVKVQFDGSGMIIDMLILVRYGCAIKAVAQRAQEAVCASVESMTGMGTPVVNVHVCGVAFDK